MVNTKYHASGSFADPKKMTDEQLNESYSSLWNTLSIESFGSHKDGIDARHEYEWQMADVANEIERRRELEQREQAPPEPPAKLTRPNCETKGHEPHKATHAVVYDLSSGRVARFVCEQHLERKRRGYYVSKLIGTCQ
jgi:hypothetical protein